jgi:hypothetical protein
MMDELPGRDAFAECLHERFQVVGAQPDELELELFEVSELRELSGTRTFSIVFRGPATRFLPQRTYRLRHPRLGELDLFLVPVGRQAEDIHYETVFNHLVKQP